MKAFRLIAVLVLAGALLIGLGGIVAALSSGQSLNLVVYGVIALVVLVSVMIFKNNLFNRVLGRVGESTGEKRGPEPGEGAVIHHSSGEADFDGSPGDVPPSDKTANRDLPYPPDKSAD